MTISSATDFSKPARRFTDFDARTVEHAARSIAQCEGVTSTLWQEIQKIDSYRRAGRLIDITLLYKVHGEINHRIKWVERESEASNTFGFIDQTLNKKPRKYGEKILLAAGIFIMGFYFGAAYNAFLR